MDRPNLDRRREELLDFYAREVPAFDPGGDHAGTPAAAFMGAYHEIPALELESRGESVEFHPENVRTTVEYLYEREDCADFGLAALMRILHGYPDSAFLDDSLRGEIEDGAAEFVYWLDEPGEESMCFWTENHQILFHSSQLLAGQRLPDRTFSNGESGDWHRETGRKRAERWLDWRLRLGFSEWHSNHYYEEDALALANLADFADDEAIRRKARAVLDLLFFHLAVNSHEGVFGTPHGRTYARALLDPPAEPTAPLYYLQFGRGTFREAGMTRAGPVLAASDYERPELLERIARHDPDEFESRERHSLDVSEAPEYGLDPDSPEDLPFFLGAQVYNHRDVIETALDAIPEKHYLAEHVREAHEHYRRQEERAGTWKRMHYDPDPNSQAMTRADLYTFRTPEYMLSATGDYRPGKAGFQQHVWQATLGAQAPVYTTHPGRESMDGRPNYWHGNGVLPRVAAHRNLAICVYRIDPDRAHPDYTHAYVPRHVFEECRESAGWVFGRVGEGYVALRSARQTEWRAPDWGPNAEASEYVARGADTEIGDLPAYDLVAAGTRNVWTCELGRESEYGSFDGFVEAIGSADVDEGTNRVTYDSPSVGEVSFGWDRDLLVEGDRIEFDHPRFDNPYCEAAFGDAAFEIEHGGETLRIDPDGG